MSLTASLQVVRMFARLVGRVPIGHLWYLFRRMRDEKPHRFDGQIRVNTFFPPYPSQAFDRFCQAVIDRRRVPYSTYLAVTDECPYSCGHCSYAGRAGGELSDDQLLEVVEQIKGLGTCTLGLTGGEPLLRDDLERLIEAAAPEMVCVIFTTGHRLDARRALRLAASGVSCVTVGIESADAATHDLVRQGPGSFAEAEDAVLACQQAGIYTAISTVGTREKIATGELEAIHQLGTRWGVGEFRLLTPVATGGWTRCGAAMLSADELQVLIDFHVQHNRSGDGPAVASFACLESDALFGCGAGFHHLFIDATGQVRPCDLTPLSLGDVTSEPLEDIWERMGEFFSLPRCGCLMRRISDDLADADDDALPLPREQSEVICPRRGPEEPLPEAYRRLYRDGSPPVNRPPE